MGMRAVLTAALAVAIGYGSAGAIVWPGGDDGGYLTLGKAASKCEQKAAGNLGKLAGAIIKCQDKMVKNAFKAKAPIDEQACENAAITKYTGKTVTTDCPCVNTANNASIAESVINGNGGLVNCDSASGVKISTALPDNGAAQIDGWLPSTKDIAKAESKIGKAVSKYAAGWFKCHAAAAKSYLKTAAYDDGAEENCESANQAVFETAFNAQTLRAGCEDMAAIESVTFTQLESAASLNFCVQSPSGAFVQ